MFLTNYCHCVYSVYAPLVQSLDGQNIYDRCCTMRVEASKLKTLTVKSNNDRQRFVCCSSVGLCCWGIAVVRALFVGIVEVAGIIILQPFYRLHSLYEE